MTVRSLKIFYLAFLLIQSIWHNAPFAKSLKNPALCQDFFFKVLTGKAGIKGPKSPRNRLAEVNAIKDHIVEISSYSQKQKGAFRNTLNMVHLRPHEWEQLLDIIEQVPSRRYKLDRLHHYLDYHNIVLRDTDRSRLLNNIYHLFQEDSVTSDLAKFYKTERKVIAHQNKVRAKEFGDLKKMYRMEDSDLEKLASLRAKKRGDYYRSLLYSCSGKSSLTAKKMTKRLAGFFVGGQLFMTLAVFLENNLKIDYDRFRQFDFASSIDYNARNDDLWQEKMLLDISAGMLLSLAYSLIISSRDGVSSKDGGAIKKMRQGFLYLGVIGDLIKTYSATKYCDVTEQRILEKLEELRNREDFKSEVRRLAQVMKKERIWQKFQRFLGRAKDFKDQNPENISPQDMDKEIVREFLAEEIARDEYEKKAGFIRLGHLGPDLYAANRMFDTVAIPKSIGMGWLIYSMICRLEHVPPLLTYTLALAVFASDSYITTKVYNIYRSWAVGY